jgi:hypothetical protein
VWSIPASAWPALDGFEPGYARREIEVCCEGPSVRAQTYVATQLTADPVASAEYKRLLLAAAREHGLPEDHLARLESLPCRAGLP